MISVRMTKGSKAIGQHGSSKKENGNSDRQPQMTINAGLRVDALAHMISNPEIGAKPIRRPKAKDRQRAIAILARQYGVTQRVVKEWIVKEGTDKREIKRRQANGC